MENATFLGDDDHEEGSDPPLLGALRIWWLPDAENSEAVLFFPTNNIEESVAMLNLLAQYDLMRMKSGLDIIDYVNQGGVEQWNGYTWIDWTDDIPFEEMVISQTVH